MNKEIIKAMNKRETKINNFGKWWNKNSYKVMRVVFFPIWGCICAKYKIESYLNSKCEWSEEKANKILSYYIPRKAEWDAENKCFYFFDNGYGWSMCYAKKYLKRKDRHFWKIYGDWIGGKVRSYLIDEFELEGFEKKVYDCYDGRTEISFTMIEK